MLDGAVREYNRKPERAHSAHLLPLVATALAEAGVAAKALDAVAFGCGPGPFTGVRLAASVAQGLAFGANASVLPVSSTLALAAAARSAAGQEAGVVASIRSRRDVFYLAAYGLSASGLCACRADQLCTAPPDWPEVQAGWPGVGPRPDWLADHPWLPDVVVDAALIARLGAESFEAGGGLAPEFGLPAYVEGDTPWRKTGEQSKPESA